MFDKHRTTISRQVKTEVSEIGKNASVCAKFARTGADEKNYFIDCYNSLVVNVVGIKTNPDNLAIFKDWIKSIFINYQSNIKHKCYLNILIYEIKQIGNNLY